MANKTIYPFGTNGSLPSGTVIVNDLNTGGANKMLSAEQGKVIKDIVSIIMNSLGDYAFPNGKPTIDWSGLNASVSMSLSSVTSSNSSTSTAKGQSYTTTLTGIHDNSLYSKDVVVRMGGIDITSTAYNTSTGVVSIADVTGGIEITASEIPLYIQSGLVFQLDGIEKGATSGKWTDLVGGVVWDNNGATSNTNCWQFDGTNYLTSSNMGEYDIKDCTIEVCLQSSLSNTTYFVFVDSGAKMVFNYIRNYSSADWWVARGYQSSGSGIGALYVSDNGSGTKLVSITGASNNQEGGMVNGVSKLTSGLSNGAKAQAIIGGRFRTSDGELNMPFTGKVFSIRIYDRMLSTAEMLANQRADNMRFSLGLSI